MKLNKKLITLYDFCLNLTKSSSARQIFITFIFKILIVFVGFATAIILTRKLGPAGLGIYAVAGVIGTMGVKFTNLGINTAHTYFLSRDKNLASQIFMNSIIFSFIVSFILLIFGLLFYKSIPNLISLNTLLIFLIFLWILFSLIYLFLSHMIMAISDVSGFNWIELISKVAFLVLLVALIPFGTISVELAFILLLLTLVLGVFLCVFRLKTKVILKKFTPSLKLFKLSVKYGIRIFITTSLAYTILRLDTLIIDHFLGAAQTGYYAVSSRVFDMLTLLPAALMTVLLPKMSSSKSIDDSITLMKKSRLSLIIFYIPSLVIFAFLAKPLILIFFGNEFLPSVIPMLILLPGVFFLGISNPLILFLHSLGYPISGIWAWVLTLIANISLNFILVPKYGISGAALAATLSQMILYLALYLSVKYEIKKNYNKKTSLDKDMALINGGM